VEKRLQVLHVSPDCEVRGERCGVAHPFSATAITVHEGMNSTVMPGMIGIFDPTPYCNLSDGVITYLASRKG